MKKNLFVLLPLAAVLCFGSGCSRHADHDDHAADHASVRYTCPMHPNYIADKPGDCPICGMTLVPVDTLQQSSSTAAPAGYAPVTLTPEQVRALGVRSVAAQLRMTSVPVRTTGTVAYDPELYTLEQEYLSAVAGGNQALRQATRNKLALRGISGDELKVIEKNGAPDAALLLGAAEGILWIYAPVYQQDAASVRPGQKAVVRFSAGAEASFDGVVASVEPALEAATRSSRARIQVRNRDGLLKPGMYADVVIAADPGERLVVPADAVMDTGDRQIVFVETGPGSFEPRQVNVSGRADDDAFIGGGLDEGEQVAVNANFLIDSESRLRASFEQSAHQH